MSTLSQKIDFAVIIRVKNANPNGDPLNGNRPRTGIETPELSSLSKAKSCPKARTSNHFSQALFITSVAPFTFLPITPSKRALRDV